jgi:hypothetical protein
MTAECDNPAPPQGARRLEGRVLAVFFERSTISCAHDHERDSSEQESDGNDKHGASFLRCNIVHCRIKDSRRESICRGEWYCVAKELATQAKAGNGIGDGRSGGHFSRQPATARLSVSPNRRNAAPAGSPTAMYWGSGIPGPPGWTVDWSSQGCAERCGFVSSRTGDPPRRTDPASIYS